MRKLFVEIRDKEALKVIELMVKELEKNVNENTMEAEAYGIKVKVQKYGGNRIPVKAVVEEIIKNYLNSQAVKVAEMREKVKKEVEEKIKRANLAIEKAKAVTNAT